MSFWIMVLIICISSLIGGTVNYLLPANSTDGKFVKPWWQCVILGLGATLLVPIFLELAQSKLLENIHFGNTWERSVIKDSSSKKVDTLIITVKVDTAGRPTKSDTVIKNGSKGNGSAGSKDGNVPDPNPSGKDYFLWASYCLLAAASGFKFIDMIINKMVTAKQLEEVKSETQQLKKAAVKQAKADVVKQDEKAKNMLQNAQRSETDILSGNRKESVDLILPNVTYWNDPQKGRFGSLAKRGDRLLQVNHIKEITGSGGLYQFELWVESTNSKMPLTGEVVFYLHNTFDPSVIVVQAEENKAVLPLTNVYGAFTVGAIADNGKILLELDLVSVSGFSQSFKEQ